MEAFPSFLLLFLFSLLPSSCLANMASQFYTGSSTSAQQLATFLDSGNELQLLLDQSNASGFSSYSSYLFGSFTMQMKLVPGDSAGTVTTYYFSSPQASSGVDRHDECDFEFLGNSSGEPIVLQTNIYASGVGGREQRIFLWFDPTANFHNYSLLWNELQIVFSVDGIPIRVFPNIEATTGVPFLHSQAMNVYGTIWDGDSWATQGGRIKLNWTHSPFVASYRDFSADACSDTATMSATQCAATKWWNGASFLELDASSLGQLSWVQENQMIYNYCTDTARYNVTPPECLYTKSTLLTEASVSPSPSSSSTPSSGVLSPSSSPTAGSSPPAAGSLSDTSSPAPSPALSQHSKGAIIPLNCMLSTILFIVMLCVHSNL